MPGDVIRGPWPQLPEATRAKRPPPGWKRGGLAGMSTTEARRDEILALKPRCRECEIAPGGRRPTGRRCAWSVRIRVSGTACIGIPFKPGFEPPRDGLCRDCREALNAPPPDDPALF